MSNLVYTPVISADTIPRLHTWWCENAGESAIDATGMDINSALEAARSTCCEVSPVDMRLLIGEIIEGEFA